MTYLLDVSALLAWLWEDHEHHERVLQWQNGQEVAVCAITELGFVRISTQPIFGATVSEALEMLEAWHQKIQPQEIPCDLSVRKSAQAPSSGKTTDYYLASLARKHGMTWATLDESCAHPSAHVIPFNRGTE